MIPRLGEAHNGKSPTTPATAQSLARELLGPGVPGDADAPATAEALQRAFARVSDNLRHSIGEDGYRALLGRAIAKMRSDQPVWTGTRYAGLGIELDVVAAADRHGAAAAGAALVSLVAALFDILSDLIGAEMARNLLEYDHPRRAVAGGES